jgi:hypothetical protein
MENGDRRNSSTLTENAFLACLKVQIQMPFLVLVVKVISRAEEVYERRESEQAFLPYKQISVLITYPFLPY